MPPAVIPAFALCRAYNLCLRHFGLQDLLGTLELQLVVLDDDYLEVFHIWVLYFVMTLFRYFSFMLLQ